MSGSNAAAVPTGSPKVTYHTLDALRGIAAIAVVLGHATPLFLPFRPMPSYPLAVDLFFALSGFVLAHSYGAKLSRDLTWRAFMRTRLIRLYPLYILGAALGVLAEIAKISVSEADALSPVHLGFVAITAVFFLPSPPAHLASPLFLVNLPAWSLFFELVTNAGYARFFRQLTRLVLVGVMAISGAVLCYATFLKGDVVHGTEWATFIPGLCRATFSFALGVVLYGLKDQFPRFLGYGGAVLAPVLLSLALMGAPPDELRPWYDLAFVMIVVPLLIIAGSMSQPAGRVVPAFAFLGTISYAIYAIHAPLVQMTTFASTLVPQVPPSLFGIVLVLGLLILCVALDRFYDRPVRRWLTGKAGQRNVPDARGGFG